MLAEAEDANAYFATDHLGTILASTDEGGAVRGMRDYYPYGALRFSNGDIDAHGFTGQEQDVTTGLISMQHRSLDPLTGRWDAWDPAFVTLSADNMAKLGEATTGYAYAANAVSWANDPTGLAKKVGFKAKMKKIGRNIAGAARFLFSKPGKGVSSAIKGTQYDMGKHQQSKMPAPTGGLGKEKFGRRMMMNIGKTANSMTSTSREMGLDKMMKSLKPPTSVKSESPVQESSQLFSRKKKPFRLLTVNDPSQFAGELLNHSVGMDMMMDDIVLGHGELALVPSLVLVGATPY